MKHKQIILDVDTGLDDSLALMLALNHPDINVLGITTVSGRVPAEQAYLNTIQLINRLDTHERPPVIKGSGEPLLNRFPIATHQAHSKEEQLHRILDGSSVEYPVLDEHAVTFMINTILKNAKPVTLVLMGPLTNFALALKVAPEIVDYISDVIVMGGAEGKGNITSVAEFNIYCDPEAAQIVLGHPDLNIHLITLDICQNAFLTEEDLETLLENDQSTSQLALKILQGITNQFKNVYAPICGAATLLYATDSELLEGELAEVSVETGSPLTRGMTVINRESYGDGHVFVPSDIDHQRFTESFVRTLVGESL